MDITPCGLPHSDISGSMLVCSSPKLFAAYHVLLRLLTPRHPSCALSSLTTKKQLFRKKIVQLSLNISCLRHDFSIITLFLQNFLQDFFNCQTAAQLRPLSGTSPRIFPDRSGKSFSPASLIWWAYLDLNQGPRPYQGRALTS